MKKLMSLLFLFIALTSCHVSITCETCCTNEDFYNRNQAECWEECGSWGDCGQPPGEGEKQD